MWKAITYVSSGVTLAAFIAAVAAWVYRHHTVRTERMISLAPEKQRAGLIKNALESFSIDPSGLSETRKYQLLSKQLVVRHQRFRTTCTVVVIIACLGTFIVLFALWQAPQSQSLKNLAEGGPTPSPTPAISASQMPGVPSPSASANQEKVRAPTQATGEKLTVEEPSNFGDKVTSELREKNLIPLLNQANNFAQAHTSSADLQALSLYKRVINGLSPGARIHLDKRLMTAAEAADRDNNLEGAVRNYRSLFSTYKAK